MRKVLRRIRAGRGGAGTLETAGMYAASGLIVAAIVTVAGPAGPALAEKVDCVVQTVVGAPADRCGEPIQGGGAGGAGPRVILNDTSGPGLKPASPARTPNLGVRPTPPRTSASFVPTDREDPNNVLLQPSFWDKACGVADPAPFCASYPGLEIPECEPPSLPEPAVNLDPGLGATDASAGNPRTAKLVQAVEDAQNYYCRRFGWRGYDGKGGRVSVTAGSEALAAADSQLPILKFSDRLVDKFADLLPGTALHEFTHLVFRQFMPTVDAISGEASALDEQTFAVYEGMSLMSELEVRGRDYVANLADPLAAAKTTPWTCPVADTGAYANATQLLAAFTDIARNSGGIEYGGTAGVTAGDEADGPGTLDPAWPQMGPLRWAVLSKRLPAYATDGRLSFGELRQAFVAAARDVGMDPFIVGQAFTKQGIDSIDYEPPPCDWSQATPHGYVG